jgi:hypothetical protein
MLTGASLDEVWCDAADMSLRDAPGSRRCNKSGRSAKVSSSSKSTNEKAGSSKKVRAVQPSCAATDPLCDLYNHGYSNAMNDTMDLYSTGDMYDKTPYSRKAAQAKREPAGAMEGVWGGAPVGGEDLDHDKARRVEADRDFGPSHNIDFYDEEEDNALVDQDKDTDTETDHDADSRDIKGKPDVTSSIKQRAAVTRDAARDSIEARANLETEPGSREHEQVGLLYGILQVILYIASGIILIVILEQFIQLGVKLRGY